MISALDEQMLRRALRVAMTGRGRVEPNPMVGCVLVANGALIAEGHHTHFGGPHAEPTALADCIARGHSPRGATAYVTLEPCCHTNKKTPPCAPRLIEAGVARVVVGCLDPNPDVDGKGVAMLRQAGIAVDTAPPELAALFLQLIAPFTQRTNTGRPYLTMKWAQSRDGKIAGPGGARRAISGPAVNRIVHRLRGHSDAIVVGIGTVLNDDPNLLPRDVDAGRTPVRVVLDSALRTPVTSQLARTTADGPVLVYTRPLTTPSQFAAKAALEKAGVEVCDSLPTDDACEPNRISVRELTADWARRKWADVMIEPGTTLGNALSPFVDRAWVIESSERIADDTAPVAPTLRKAFVETGSLALGPDTLTEYLSTAVSSFVTATPSADFVLETEHAAGT